MACSKCIALRCIEPFDLSTRFNLAANGLFKLQTRDGSEFLKAFNFSERERLREGKRSLKNFNIDFANTFYIFFLFVLEVSSITIFDSSVYCSDWKVYISVTTNLVLRVGEAHSSTTAQAHLYGKLKNCYQLAGAIANSIPARKPIESANS